MKQTSETARYWHGVSWDLPLRSGSAPEPPATPVPEPSASPATAEVAVEGAAVTFGADYPASVQVRQTPD
ncbi:hypothetical protein FRAHR75_200024 [Frankia sp. Hr75.2]|nr:hypothetical protein FRAHR75_200024 [Frankia sp. Hr75.2]